jgi:hypothetical protein
MENWRVYRYLSCAGPGHGCRGSFALIYRLDSIRAGSQRQCALHIQFPNLALFCRILDFVSARTTVVLVDHAQQVAHFGADSRCSHWNDSDIYRDSRTDALAVGPDPDDFRVCDGFLSGSKRFVESRDDEMAGSDSCRQKAKCEFCDIILILYWYLQGECYRYSNYTTKHL